MNKKILAAAVAGALALPGLALAQTAVSITGTLAVGFGTNKIRNASPLRTTQTSSTQFADEVSKINFTVTEDLGGGLRFTGQYQILPCLDAQYSFVAAAATPQATTNMTVCSGNSESWVGLASNVWGQLRMGSLYTQGTATSGFTAGIASASILSATNMTQSLIIAGAAGTVAAPAVAQLGVSSGRFPSTMRYDSPTWGGFNFVTAYSTSGGAAGGDTDLSTPATLRKGRYWTINPEYNAAQWGVGFAYGDKKPDYAGGPAAGGVAVAVTAANTPVDVKYWNAYGTISPLPGLRVRLTYSDHEAKNTNGAINLATGSDKRGHGKTWLLSSDYSVGPHVFGGQYSRYRDSVIPGDTKAYQIQLAYAYKFSNRTSVGVGFVRINNGANTNFALTGATGSYVEQGNALIAGEDQQWWGVGIKHNF